MSWETEDAEAQWAEAYAALTHARDAEAHALARQGRRDEALALTRLNEDDLWKRYGAETEDDDGT